MCAPLLLRVQRYNIFLTLQALLGIFLYLRIMFVATIGFFDGVHCGHRYLISRVKAEAARVGLRSMVVTMDRHPKKVVDTDYVPQLLTTTEERIALLQGTGVDRVEVMHFDREMSMMSARDFMRLVLHDRYDVSTLIMGYDHRFGHGGGTREDYIRWGEECGIRVVMAPQLTGTYASSSVIRRMLQAGDVSDAARLLGHPYMLTGTVENGHKIGRTLGFPTANLHISQEKLIPANGVYAVETTIGRGIMNIGRRPTLDNGSDLSIEVHILDYAGDLYGQTIQLQFLGHIREEKKFASLEELKEHIRQDIDAALKIFAATDKNT